MDEFKQSLKEFGEYGEVLQVNSPIVTASGLPSVQPKEMVLFETGERGWIISLNDETVDILQLGSEKIPVGTRIVRTKKTLAIPVGDYLKGRTIDPLGKPLDEGSPIPKTAERYPVDIPPTGIKSRARIKRPLKTGTTLVDMMIPIGQGQKELVIGDRKTGKTAFVLNTMKRQIEENTITIYCLIGKKKNDIKAVEDVLEEEGLREGVIMVAASSYDPSSLIYLAPFSAMTIAEYFAAHGQNVLVILDDLFTHARFYREMSLVAKNFPGRDSYPGDIFYTHARLLERAGNFKHENGDVSITCLPVVETVEGDITGYIQTNLMGITDGHILFDNELFSNGQRPAINIQLSVTRAGRQTQSQLNHDITRELTSFFALYIEMQNLSHFGTELTESAAAILKKGDALMTFFNQPQMTTLAESVQLILFSLIWLDAIREQTDIVAIRKKLRIAYTDPKQKTAMQDLLKAETFNTLLQNVSRQKEILTRL